MTLEFAPPAEAIDIGGGHRIVFVEYKGAAVGIDDWHRNSKGAWCCGWIAFRGSAWAQQFGADHGWDVIQREPLTLSPSLLCRTCGNHGHITNGKWVPA